MIIAADVIHERLLRATVTLKLLEYSRKASRALRPRAALEFSRTTRTVTRTTRIFFIEKSGLPVLLNDRVPTREFSSIFDPSVLANPTRNRKKGKNRYWNLELNLYDVRNRYASSPDVSVARLKKGSYNDDNGG